MWSFFLIKRKAAQGRTDVMWTEPGEGGGGPEAGGCRATVRVGA